MTASDRNKSGERKDYARHYSLIDGGSPVCGTKNYGYSTNDTNDIECEKCMVWLLNTAVEINNAQKH